VRAGGAARMLDRLDPRGADGVVRAAPDRARQQCRALGRVVGRRVPGTRPPPSGWALRCGAMRCGGRVGGEGRYCWQGCFVGRRAAARRWR
jgi:hypothetical protein